MGDRRAEHRQDPGPNDTTDREKGIASPTPQTLQKNIRFTPEQWNRIQHTAREREISPNQLVVDLTIEALDCQEWPRNETEIRVGRASLFAAQVLASGLIADGRENEVEEVREFISTIVPDPDMERPLANLDRAKDRAGGEQVHE